MSIVILSMISDMWSLLNLGLFLLSFYLFRFCNTPVLYLASICLIFEGLVPLYIQFCFPPGACC